MLHFVVQGLNAMEEAESQVGLESMQPNLQSIFQPSSLNSIKVQAKINSQYVQLQLWCMVLQVEQPAHGKAQLALLFMSIASGHLQQQKTMSFFFQIQATG